MEESCSSELALRKRNKREKLKSLKRWTIQNLAMVLTILAAGLGISVGFLIRSSNPTSRTVEYITFPGDLLLRALYMVVPPLIISSIVSGLNFQGETNLGRIVGRVFLYYSTTTIIAAFIGVAMGYLVRIMSMDEDSSDSLHSENIHAQVSVVDSVMDMFRNLVPENIVRAIFQTQQTRFERIFDNSTQENVTEKFKKVQVYSDGTNMIGMIFFSILFGISLRNVGEKAQMIADFFHLINDIIMRMVTIIMWYSPVGIFFLIAGSIAGIEHVDQRILGVIYLSLAHLLGIVIHWSILSTAYYFLVKKNPFRFMFGLKDAFIAAWAIMSSTSVLPVTIRCMEENNKIDKKVGRLVLPIGATVNMDGNSMHFVQVALFVAQVHGIPISFGALITIMLTSALASVGLAAVPNSFFVAVLIILDSVHLPTQDIVLMFTTEWILDRFRTALNVYGDCIGAAIIASREEQNPVEDESKEEEKLNPRDLEVDLCP